MEKYQKGKIIKVKVTAIEPYGAFVKIDDEYTGLIHISEITGSFIHNINDYFKLDEIISAKIIDVDPNEKHIKLSLKELNLKNNTRNKDHLVETELGFELLEDLLPKWMEDKKKEMRSKKINIKNN